MTKIYFQILCFIPFHHNRKGELFPTTNKIWMITIDVAKPYNNYFCVTNGFGITFLIYHKSYI